MKGKFGCRKCECNPEDEYCSCLCHENELCSEQEEKNKCLCGGELVYYDGCLGYEAMVCQKCGFYWDATSEEEQQKQKEVYIKEKLKGGM